MDEKEARRNLSALASKQHRWVRHSSGEINHFAYEAGDFHNGPSCLDCGRATCEHCEPGVFEEECPG